MAKRARPIKSKLIRGFLVEARARWARGDRDVATERAARVFLTEGREVFGARDRPLFDAMLARLQPPAGFESWDAWFEHDAANPQPRDDRTDDDIVDDIQREHGKTPLHDAIAAGDRALVDRLLAGGADVNAVFRNGDLRWTPLCEAVFADHLDIVRTMLDRGAHFSGPGLTSAMWGVKSIAVAELLLAHGAKLDEVDPLGRTVLARVVDTLGDVALARFLAERTPRPTPEQAAGLERAARQSSPELREIALGFLRAR